MRKLSLFALLFVYVFICQAQSPQVDPIAQINWPNATGSGAPSTGCPYAFTNASYNTAITTLNLNTAAANVLPNMIITGTGIPTGTYAASFLNYSAGTVDMSQYPVSTHSAATVNFYPVGRPYTDTTNNVQYFCSLGGWTSTASSGTTTNALTMNNGGSGAVSGATFDGSAARTLSYNTIGAAPLASPALTGTPTAPTASGGTNTTQLATTAFVQSAVSGFANLTWYAHIDSAMFATNTVLGPVFFGFSSNNSSYVFTVAQSSTISCSGAPTVNLMDLGVSATTSYGSATSVANFSTGTGDGVFSVGGTLAIVNPHYYRFAFSAGTCATPPIFDVTFQE